MLRWLMLLVMLVAPAAHAQTEVVSTVNGTPIMADAYQTRYTLEGWLQVREITAFAERFYEETPDGGVMSNALRVAFPVQLRSIYNPPRLGDVVLTSMEGNIVLQARADEQGITIDEADVDALVMRHIALTENFALNEDGTLSEAQADEFDAALEAFYEQATAFADATRDEVRALFAAQALRQAFFEQVTDAAEVEDTDARNEIFQAWLQTRLENAEVERADEWRQFTPVEPDFGDLLNAELTQIVRATPD